MTDFPLLAPEPPPRVAMRPLPAVFLLDADEDLGRLLSPARVPIARSKLRAPVVSVPLGRWTPPEAMAGSNVLALEGLLVREVIVADEVAAEIVGAGDFVPVAADEERLVPSAIRWTAIMPARLAVLGARFTTTLLDFPEIALTLMERQRQRAERLVTLEAVARLRGVERKVLALMWLLADRWGRMTGDGVVVPVTLQHSVMANVVGARRPTVSSAIGRLQRRGALGRRADGAWILYERPEALQSAMLDRVQRPRGRVLRAVEPDPGGDVGAPAVPHRRRLARLEQRAALAREESARVMREIEATRAAAPPLLKGAAAAPPPLKAAAAAPPPLKATAPPPLDAAGVRPREPSSA